MHRESISKIIVFAGTNEGRSLCEFLEHYQVQVTACVATEYGSLCLSGIRDLDIKQGRLTVSEMKEIILDYDLILDATHPYARIASENINKAASELEKPYIRIIRPQTEYDNVIECESLEQVSEYLNTVNGNVLITTGSKELIPYTKITDYENRLFVRVLPSLQSMEECIRHGFKSSHIICMQGPFSEELNTAMLRQVKAEYLVTKETGKNGGFEEKLSAAAKCNTKVIVIGRPVKEEGMTLEKTFDYLKNRLVYFKGVNSTLRIIRVGSRDSKLAVIQAQMVIDAIKKYDNNIQTELVTMKTTGDKILDVTLDKIGGKGLFVKELDDALLCGAVDITVHSFKDMPMEMDDRLPIVALSKREDPRDVLIHSQGIMNQEKPVGCSSKRRTVQLNQLGYEQIAPLRGNVITRLRKLDEGEYSAIVLAAAGIKRLGLVNRVDRYFDVSEIMPAACQGIIAVQARKGENTDYLTLFHCEESKVISDAERAFVTALEGGCSSPIAAYATLEDDQIILNGMYVSEETGIIRKGVLKGHLSEAEKIGKELAHQLKDKETM